MALAECLPSAFGLSSLAQGYSLAALTPDATMTICVCVCVVSLSW